MPKSERGGRRWGCLVVAIFGLCLLSPGRPALADSGVKAGLPAALAATLVNHPAVSGKRAELAGQGFSVGSAKSQRYPNLSGQVSSRDSGRRYGSLRLRQPLWAFGKIDIPIAREKERYRAEELRLLQVQRRLLEQAAMAYAAILGLRQQVLIADENLVEHRKLYQRIERRQGGQMASEADVRLAYSRLSQAEAQRERIASELQSAMTGLRALTQIEIETSAPVDPSLLELPETERIKSLAQKHHADILFKQRLIDVAKYGVAYEKVSAAPTLYAEAERDFFDSATADETHFGLVLEGSLGGAGLGIVSRVKSASAQVDAARQDLRSTRNDVRLQMDRLLTDRSLQTRLQRAQQAAVDAVRETRESYLRQYDSGRKSWLDVLNIQRELTEQRLQLAQAGSNGQTLSLRMAALIGRLDAVAGMEPVSKAEEGLAGEPL